MGMGMRGPSVNGVWSPVVGSGAAYQVENKREGKQEIEIAIVAAETAAGKPGHWMEMSFKSADAGRVVMRQLQVLDLTLWKVVDDDLQRAQHCHDARRALIQVLANEVFEHREFDNSIGARNANRRHKITDCLWRIPEPPQS